MKSFPAVLVLLSLFGSLRAPAAEFKIDLRIDRKPTAEIVLKVEGDVATTVVGSETERFNLKEMSWLAGGANQWITLAQSMNWAEQSKATTTRSAATAPAEVRSFVLWSMNPTYKVTRTNDTVRLTSGQVDYLLEGSASKTNADGYFRYAIINAYKKAMIEKTLPPFPEVKALEEMKALGYVPRKISITIPGVPGSPAFEMEVTETKP